MLTGEIVMKLQIYFDGPEEVKVACTRWPPTESFFGVPMTLFYVLDTRCPCGN